MPKLQGAPSTFDRKATSASARTSPTSVFTAKDQCVDIQETGNYIIIPPDGGWGWVVVISAFITFTFTDGLSYCFGLFMVDMAADMKVSVTMVSITTSLITGEVFLLGPVFCAMINRYGFRLVAFIGAFGSTVCVVSSSWAPNYYIFLVVMGVIGGIFLSMCYITSCVIVGFYFDRWRVLATAIAVSGSAAGIVVVPLILGFLHGYSWRVQFRVIGGILVLIIFLSLTYRPVVPVRVDEEEPLVSQFEQKWNILNKISAMDPSIAEYDFETAGPKSSIIWDNRINRMHNLRYPTARDMQFGGGTMMVSTMTPYEYRMTKSTNQSLVSEYNKIDDDDDDTKKRGFWRCWTCDCCQKKLVRTSTMMYVATRPLYREDILYHGPLSRLDKYKEAKAAADTKSTASGTSFATLRYHMDVTRMAAYQDILDQQSKKCVFCPHAVVRILSTMFDMSLLRNCSFTTFMFSGFFTGAGMFLPFIYVTEMNIAAGQSESISRMLLSVMGFMNILGRIMCGLISISPKIKPIIVMEVALMISGIVTIIMPFYPNIYVQYFCGCVFGITVAVNGALRPIVIVDLYGLEKLTNGFGIAILFEGVACTIGIPFAGLLKDLTGSYHALMGFTGACLTFSGLLIIPVQALANREKHAEYAKMFPWQEERDKQAKSDKQQKLKKERAQQKDQKPKKQGKQQNPQTQEKQQNPQKQQKLQRK